ncbi:MAG: hypothetical protein K2Q14_05765 [Gammaproteobacteria bacterium]|nr:hypothetical protein [Gammaproteobacteria bacterium]
MGKGQRFYSASIPQKSIMEGNTLHVKGNLPLKKIKKPENWDSTSPLCALRRNLATILLRYLEMREGKIGDLGLLRAENMSRAYQDIIKVEINEADKESPTPIIDKLSEIIREQAAQQNNLSYDFGKYHQYIRPKSSPAPQLSLIQRESLAKTELLKAAELINVTRACYKMERIDVFEDLPLPDENVNLKQLPEDRSEGGCSIM